MGSKRTSSDWIDDYPMLVGQEVHETVKDTFTGLYRADGSPIHTQREPIGIDPYRWERKTTRRKGQKNG